MKINFFRIGILGIVVLLGWIAAVYAQNGAGEATAAGNPLRGAAERPAPRKVVPIPDQNQSPPDDSIPDASDVDLPTRDAAETAAGEGPGIFPAPDSRRAAEPFAPAQANSKLNNRLSGNRLPTSRTLAENNEPAPFTADPFAEPLAQRPAKIANRPARTNQPFSGMRPVSAVEPIEEVAPNLAPAQPGGGLMPVEQNGSAPEGTGQPGAKQLEGPQSPQVTIQKAAPAEIQVGRPAIFKTVVRNTGMIPAGQVEVLDQVPKGTRLLNTTPRATQGERGELLWKLGTLRPGEESAVEMELMPIAEGEIGSVATVHFGADASAKTISTRPQIAVQTTAPGQVLIGEKVNLTITISNPGTGVATGVVLEEHLPAGLQHAAGSELEYEIGVLKPRESKKLELQLIAAAAGPVTNLLTVRADGNLRTEDRLQLDIVAPQLDIAMEGPKKRYLEREAVYQVSISNPGTAPAQGVELAAYLPPGLKFVRANNQGHYDEASRAVFWKLEQLPSQVTGSVELVALPVEAGQQSIKLRGAAQRVQPVEKEQPVIVEGIAAVLFQVADTVDPIEIGGESAYEIRVTNQGSKAASNVRLSAVLPAELQPLAADGPTRYAVQGNTVVFEGLARLAPKAETVYHLRVKGLRPGDLRARFQLLTDDMQSPVTKEESTQVYADE
jgi:uncharacterized repeat protein (TIGR01451 family)